jgi:hypothetical protein
MEMKKPAKPKPLSQSLPKPISGLDERRQLEKGLERYNCTLPKDLLTVTSRSYY